MVIKIVNLNKVSSVVTGNTVYTTKVKSAVGTVSITKMRSTVSTAKRVEYYFEEETRV